MDDFLSQLDSANAGDVPALCLVYADWLDERADPEAEGWMALGRLGKVPWVETSPSGAFRYGWNWHGPDDALQMTWYLTRYIRYSGYPSRSIALQAAAQAFSSLDDDAKRRILTETITWACPMSNAK